MRSWLLGLASCLLVSGAAHAGLPAGPLEAHGPATLSLGVIDSPVVTGDRFAIRGMVSYEGVATPGHLEMWSVFPDGSRYFSRTLAESGPMAKLAGSAPPRAFVLPFSLEPGSPRPVRLELNVVLPGAGHVTLRDVAFVSGDAATSTPGAWWSAEAAGRVGGLAGASVGAIGAMIGILSSLGRGRRLVLAALLALGVSGLFLLAAGIAAFALGQPYEVWYPLVLLGVLDPALGFGLLPVVRRRFEARGH